MAVARKTKAAPAVIDAEAVKVSVSAPIGADPVIPALQETLEATLNTAEEVQEHVRRAAEEGVEKTKEIYEKLKVAAEEATASVETSISAISKGVNDINLKALEALKVNSDAQFAFLKALLATKSISEAITLQGEHAKSQFEALNAQAKEFAALIQQVSVDSVEPIKATFTKGLQAAA